MPLNRLLPFLFVITLFTGCSSVGGPPLEANQASETTEYLVGPGDSLNIFVWRNPEVSTGVTVRPDGRISAPLVEELMVEGLTPAAVARKVEEVLSTYIRDPIVTVMVGGFVGAKSQQIRVLGNAVQPMSLPYSRGMSLLDVMIAVGGMNDFADGDNAQLIRLEKGTQKSYTVKLDSLVKDGMIAENRLLMPGDVLIIPETWY